MPTEGANDVISSVRPDVLICDIEGSEPKLIPAMDLSSLRAVAIEMQPKRVSADKLKALRALMEKQGPLQDPEPMGGTVEFFVRKTSAA